MNTIKTEDFGKKIGGARKDMWVNYDGTETVTEKEVKGLKRKVFKFDAKALYEKGLSRELVYWMKKVYDAIPATPKLTFNEKTLEEATQVYLRDLKVYQDIFTELENGMPTENVKDRLIAGGLLIKGSYRMQANSTLITNTVWKILNKTPQYFQRDILKERFLMSAEDAIKTEVIAIKCMNSNIIHTDRFDNRRTLAYKCGAGTYYLRILNDTLEPIKIGTYYIVKLGSNPVCLAINIPEDEVEAKKAEFIAKLVEKENTGNSTKKARKSAYKLAPLAKVERIAPTYTWRTSAATGDDYLTDFNFYGGEFGNWLSEKERLEVLNVGYDAFADLALALGISFKDITFDGKLAIAYGARGHGKALAHYEPERKVINITKMKGAGSLAHEWGHFLDNVSSNYSAAFLTTNYWTAPKVWMDVVKAMKYDENNHQTEYYTASMKMDALYSKEDKGYWASNIEMFARAFACYVKDKLSELGIRNDYLTGHAENAVYVNEDNVLPAYPIGEERRRINEKIDAIISYYKEIGVFHAAQYEAENPMDVYGELTVIEEDDGQLKIIA